MIQVLSRRTKNNPVLIGEPGVGKTAIVEGLAQRIVQGRRAGGPEEQAHRGARPGRAGRRRQVSRRVRGAAQGRAQGSDRRRGRDHPVHRRAAHRRRRGRGARARWTPATCSSRCWRAASCTCIGATTLDEYRKHIEKDAALERRFQPVLVDEPSVEDTISILRGLKERYEVHHGVRIQDAALVAAAVLSQSLYHRPVPAGQGHRPDGRGGLAAAHGDRQHADGAGRDRAADHAAGDRASRR